MKKLLLVDGYSMLFRAYYATAYGRPMTTSGGIPTNAVFGFANMMQKALDTIQPDSVLVAFDAGKHTFRHEIYSDYKGGRKPAPEDLVPQFSMVRDYLDGYGIRWVELESIEADDLIGTLSKEAEDYETTILTSDHDLLQLIDDSTDVLLMKKGLTEMDRMTVKALQEQMGIRPSQIIDLKGLMGDSSDNIPGIPGVGEKTALKLLGQYDTVEGVLAHQDEIKGALGNKVREGADSARMSKLLATIKRDVALDFTADDCAFRPDYGSLIRFLKSLDMNTLAGKYEELAQESSTAADPAAKYERVQTVPAYFLNDGCTVFVDGSQEMYMKAELYGLALCREEKSVYISLEDALQDAGLCRWLADESQHRTGYDVKRSLHLLKRAGLEVVFSDDAMIMASLADSTLTSTDKIMDNYGLRTRLSYEDVYGRPSRPKMPDLQEQAEYACESAMNVQTLAGRALKTIEEEGMIDLYRNIEMPLTFILCRMEEEGIRCDAGVLGNIAAQMKQEMDAEQAAIFESSGKDFNINSPKQLSEVLYDDLGLPSGKKRSTAADVLEKLNGVHPVISHILKYRKLQKIYSTYAEGLQKYIFRDGRIHTVYNQCATQTGRLSSSEPNLQNISVRDEQGRMIRKAFLPSEGCVLISSDYHQIELRMLAHMADEQSLIDAFNSGIDIHTKTAMDVFNVTEAEVDGQMRRRAKTVNFGIVYGISDFGLAEQLGISRKEAADFIEQYYRSYPGIRSYMQQVVRDCEKNGYVTTLCGRRRDIPEIHDKNRMIREFGKRAAMNAPIQGSAADLIKIAMINIDRSMKQAGMKSRMILQVHDELIFDVLEEETEEMKKLIEEGMVSAMKLKVPLTVECSVGQNWYEAK